MKILYTREGARLVNRNVSCHVFVKIMDLISEYKDYLHTKSLSELAAIIQRVDGSKYPDRLLAAEAERKKVLHLPKEHPRRNETIDLTSTATPYFKYFLPIFTILMVSLNVIGFFRENPLLLIAIFILMVPLVWLLYFGHSLKRVSIDKDFLYVTGWKKSIKIPRSQIDSAHSGRLLNPRHIKIYFREASDFGKVIEFIPKMDWVKAFDEHPFAGELLNPNFPENLFTRQKHGS